MQNEPFPKLAITTVQYLRWGHESKAAAFIVPSRVFGTGADRVQTVEQALEVVFRQLNAVDGTELISDPEWLDGHPNVRSMSVGDVVTFRGPGGWRRDYVCEGLGWTEISREDGEWLVKYVSARDYLGTFTEVKAAQLKHEPYGSLDHQDAEWAHQQLTGE
jgi:hypothetical protein